MHTQTEDGSVTRWIRELKSGNLDALSKLWDRYFPTIKRNARKHFGANPRIVRDEEDIALSVLGVLCKQATLADVYDREGLLRLLLVITQHKVCSEKRVQRADFRGGGHVSVITDLGEMLKNRVANLSNDAPTPDTLAIIADQYRRLLEILPDDLYRAIVKLKLIGKSIGEIADELDVVPRTVHRKLKIIRDTWIESMEKTDDGLI